MELYFPESVYADALAKYLNETGIDPRLAYAYSITHIDFFVEVAFSYVEGSPWPMMETT